MRRLRTVAAAAAAALLGGGVAALGPGPAAQAAPTIEWEDCQDADLSAIRARCGFLDVPLNWSAPAGKKIKIRVSRVAATVPEQQRQGVMLVNPGGPGGSGLALAGLRDVVPDGAGKAYDWIGFDPRGVGRSEPRVNCDPSYTRSGNRPAYVPASDGEKLAPQETAWLDRSRGYAKACGEKNGDLLAHLKTEDTVRDMDLLRQALGEKKINFYGFSYGTYLGQVYATLFPDRVRRMVFDGNVHPGRVWYDAQLAQDRAFEKAADAFFDWIAKHQGTYDLGATGAAVRERYFAELARLRSEPAGEVGPAEWTDTFSTAMYAEFLWPAVADALASWVHERDVASLTATWDRFRDDDDNGFAVYNAVQCTDMAWPDSYRKTWRPDAFATAAKAPFLTWSNVWYNTPCLTWPAKAGTPVQVDGAQAPPILLINATGDAATPFSGAKKVRALFPKARLVAEQGATTHSNSLSGNTCIDNAVAAYLADGSLPARKDGKGADLTCAALPKPTPGPQKYGENAPPESAIAPATEQPAPAPMDVLLAPLAGVLPPRAP